MKKLKLLVLTTLMSVAMSLTAFAGAWMQDTTGWWYQNDDGGHTTGNWQTIDGKMYYFGADGYMLANTITPDGYQVGADGALIPAALFDFSINTCTLKYTDYKIDTDYDGYTCLSLYYDYTNTDTESTGAWLADYSMTVFQNGIECDTTFMSYENKDRAFDNYNKDVLPGTKVNVAKSYRISDMSDVTIQIKEHWNWENPKKVSATLKLN